MPRGWRETHKPETADSQRGRRRLLWSREERDKESNLSSVSTPDSTFQHTKINEGTKGGDLSVRFAPPLLNEGVQIANSSNTTEALASNSNMCYSLTGNLQPETKLPLERVDGVSNNSSLATGGNKLTNTSSNSKPLSLLPFLGMSSTVGVMGSIASPTSVPQWMQFVGKQDTQRMTQDMSSGLCCFQSDHVKEFAVYCHF